MIGFLLKQSLYRIKIVHGRADRNMSYPAFWITFWRQQMWALLWYCLNLIWCNCRFISMLFEFIWSSGSLAWYPSVPCMYFDLLMWYVAVRFRWYFESQEWKSCKGAAQARLAGWWRLDFASKACRVVAPGLDLVVLLGRAWGAVDEEELLGLVLCSNPVYTMFWPTLCSDI